MLKNFPQYDLISFKNKNYIFDYFISFINITDFSLNLYYYSFNNSTGLNKQISHRKYIIKVNDNILKISNILCHIMENKSEENILFCFYAIQGPKNKIHMTSFSTKYNLSLIINTIPNNTNANIPI